MASTYNFNFSPATASNINPSIQIIQPWQEPPKLKPGFFLRAWDSKSSSWVRKWSFGDDNRKPLENCWKIINVVAVSSTFRVVSWNLQLYQTIHEKHDPQDRILCCQSHPKRTRTSFIHQEHLGVAIVASKTHFCDRTLRHWGAAVEWPVPGHFQLSQRLNQRLPLRGGAPARRRTEMLTRLYFFVQKVPIFVMSLLRTIFTQRRQLKYGQLSGRNVANGFLREANMWHRSW